MVSHKGYFEIVVKGKEIIKPETQKFRFYEFTLEIYVSNAIFSQYCMRTVLSVF